MTKPKQVRWWKNGDHPADKTEEIPTAERTADMVSFLTEGAVVGFSRTQTDVLCATCGAPWRIHGQLAGTTSAAKAVHPGDWVSANKTKNGYTVEHPDPTEQARRTMEANSTKT